jgi:acetyl-CoA acetyltransferase family protein
MAKRAGSSTRRVAVIEGCRTPFLRSGTGYYDLMGWEIGRHALKGLMVKTGLSPHEVDHVMMGCVANDVATTNVAREIALGAGLPRDIPAHTCTVACISANMAATNGANLIATGNADVVIAGGVETFSDPPIKVSKKYRRFILDMTMFKRPKTFLGKMGLFKKMSPLDFVIPEKPAVSEYSTGMLMGNTAERLAKKMGITRAEQDEYAQLSHQRALKALEEGRLTHEIVPVVVPGKDKAITVDNGPRAETTVEKIGKLKGAFDRKYGTVTAANSSFLTDGGSAVLLMSEEKANSLGLKPNAYIKTYA